MKHCFTNLSISPTKLLLTLTIALWSHVSFGQTTYTVTSTADTPDANLSDNICADANGDCTFRAAIQNANKTPQRDIIAFNITGQGPFYIRPEGIYNNIVQPLVIDGTTQPGWSLGKPVVVIDGSNVPIRQVGLRIMNNASGCIVRGLVMGGYRPGEDGRNGFAIRIDTDDNIIEGSYFGIDADGETALPNSRGVQIMNASNNLIGGEGDVKRNLFSGNRSIGLAIFGNEEEVGPNSVDNRVINNYFGTNAGGSTAVPNNNSIQVSQSAKGTVIHGNLVSGANFRGIVVASGETSETRITGNMIGTDHTGTQALPNNSFGINLLSGANNTIIGGLQPEDRNIIAGNGSFGIGFQVSPFAPGNSPVKENQVLGNYIGLDINGQPLPNESGILIVGLSEENTIGGIIPNVISGNTNNGILVMGENAINNTIKGNLIGVDASGENAIPNGSGISIQGSKNNTVGGTLPEERNIISGNSNHGVIINGGGENQIAGNLIGLSPSGNSPIANGQSGIYVFNSTDNIIGGSGASIGNTISGNTGAGITIAGEGSVNNSIIGNHIGTDTEGNIAIPNNFGITISNGASNTIGGVNASEGNIISGNTQDGIRVLGASATQNRITGNFVGTDENGTEIVSNGGRGIVVSQGASGTIIGGERHSSGNLVSGNLDHGILLDGPDNIVQGNLVGTDVSGTVVLPNQEAGVVTRNVVGNLIGGTDPLLRNVISGNKYGIWISNPSGPTNTIHGNYLGTDVSGTLELGNEVGVYLSNGEGTVIGGINQGESNLISGNSIYGVLILNSNNNRIEGNFIGTDFTGNLAIGNQAGLAINNDSEGNIIGGASEIQRNIVSGNITDGIIISGLNNSVMSNFIGLNKDGGELGNGNQGVRIDGSSARENLIGGIGDDEGNVISGNNLNGVMITGGASHNRLFGNYIGTSWDGLDPMPNNGNGVLIIGASNENTIGGLNTGEANTIAHNGASGILITRGPQGNVDPLRNRVSGNRISNNALSGIGLNTPDITPNDPGDADTGPNQLQNFPEIADGISFDGSRVSLRYFIPSSPDNSAFPIQVEFFVDDGNRQGRTLVFVDQFTETDYSNGPFKTLEFDLPSDVNFQQGDNILGTATDANGNTSEFGGKAVEFDLLLATEGQGTVQSEPDEQSHYGGSEITLTATPATGWVFDRWEGDLTGDTNPATLTMDGEKEVTAVFVEVENNLEINTIGEGSVAREPEQGTYTIGTEVTLTATPASGWTFDRWEGDLSGSTNPATLTMDGDREVTAIFVQLSYSLTTQTQGSGSLAIDPEGDDYIHGTEVTLNAIPAAGWAFDRWEGELTGDTNPATLTMDGEKEVTAVFVEVENNLEINTIGEGSVAREPEQGTYTTGTEVTLTATPTTGWAFDRWEGDLTGNTNPATLTMDGDREVTAVFVQLTYGLATQTQGSGSLNIEPASDNYTHGTEITLTATPATGWTFDRWEGDLTGNANPTTFTMEGDREVTAVFVQLTYGLATQTQGSGSLNIEPASDNYTHGTEITLTATPATGWTFDRWEGDLSGNTNPTMLTMDGEKEVRAIFVEIEYTLTLATEGGGQIIKDPDGTGYTHGTVVSLSAIPAEGWVFGRWEGDLSGSENPSLIMMDEDKSVMAVFVRPLHMELSLVHASCPGNSDGSITVTPSGGTAPYSYDWGAFGTSDNGTLDNLTAGTYPVTLTDANGLEYSTQAQVLDADTSAPVPDMAELPLIRENVIVRELLPPTATDVCDGSITATTDTELPIRATTTVTWTYTDSSGNSVSQEQEVRIEVDEITVYPNPVLEEGFWIAFPPSSTGIRYTATLYSAGGSLVAEREIEISGDSKSIRWDIDHPDWSNGVYLLVLRSSGGVEAVKLLKNSK